MKDRLIYQKVWLKTKHSPCQLTLFQEIPLPQGSPTITLARRTGKSLCIADKEYYSILDLEASSLFQVIPVSQSSEPTPFIVKPSITVISQNEFLLLSWTGASTLGLFITGDGDPVRGTLEWPSHPEAICAYTILNRTHCSDDSRRSRLSIYSLPAPQQHDRGAQRGDASNRSSHWGPTDLPAPIETIISRQTVHASKIGLVDIQRCLDRLLPSREPGVEHRRVSRAFNTAIRKDAYSAYQTVAVVTTT